MTSTTGAFNSPNVTLVDRPAGIDRITAAGPVVGARSTRSTASSRHRLRAEVTRCSVAPGMMIVAAAASHWLRNGRTARPASSA